jgi:hypothetical protein
VELLEELQLIEFSAKQTNSEVVVPISRIAPSH